jgi:aminoglycoside 3-N-acetyltransferase I
MRAKVQVGVCIVNPDAIRLTSEGMAFTCQQIAASELGLMQELLEVFSEAFEDPKSYRSAVPSDEYLKSLLSKPSLIALVGLSDERVVGGLVAYVLEKFEQERSEVYIYDLAVAESHRRQGIATALIRLLQHIAKERGAYVIYVQADLVDEPAIRLYQSLGTREDVLHFDIPVE